MANRNGPAGRLPSGTGVRDNWEPHAPPAFVGIKGHHPVLSLLQDFFFSFLFLKLDSGSYLTVTLFVGLSLVLAKALLLFCNQSFFT